MTDAPWLDCMDSFLSLDQQEITMSNIDTIAKAVRSAYEGVLENECVVTETDFKALKEALLVAIEQVAPENSIPDIDYIHQTYIDGYKDALGLLEKIAHSVRKPSAKLP